MLEALFCGNPGIYIVSAVRVPHHALSGSAIEEEFCVFNFGGTLENVGIVSTRVGQRRS